MTSSRASRAPRASSEERREQVIEAAVKEFAATGFHATSTTAIAKRAGISQPYVYALFPSKHDLFLAANERVVERIRGAFAEAARGPALREPVRREFMRLMDDVGRLSGAPEEEVWNFMAKGMLLNVIAALDLPEKYLPTEPA